jgi:actin-like ATPase involved in cell morphogenesis
LPAWVLGIDFGTSYTVAAAKLADRAPELIEIAGERRMPSVVMIEGETIVVGRLADDLSATNPKRAIRALKNRIGDQAPLILDGRPYQVVVLVTALLRHVYDDAVDHLREPPIEVRLTYPATWNRPRINRLLEAAAKAGLPSPVLVPEPVASALSFMNEVGIAQNSYIAVYDLGGGTFDSAIVTFDGRAFQVVGRPGGDQHVGGELFDEVIANHLGEQLPSTAWSSIQTDAEPVWQQVASTLRNEARRAKETLSASNYADVVVPLPSGLVQIRLLRTTFEDLIRPYIEETVSLLERCVSEAGIDAARLSGISLAGGSSRTPMVEDMVRAAFPSVPIIRRADPKTSVAIGATLFDHTGSLPARQLGDGTTQNAANRTPVASFSAPSIPPPPPASVPPIPPPSAVSGSLVPPPPPAPPTAPTVVDVDRPKRKRRTIILIAAAAVIAALGVGAFVVTREDDKAAPAPPTRVAVEKALLPIREVRLASDLDWVELDPTAGGDQLCEQFGLPKAAFEKKVYYEVTEPGVGVGGSDAFTDLSETISVYRTVDDVTDVFAKEMAISDECDTVTYTEGTDSYTLQLTNAEREARGLDRKVAAVRYELTLTDTPDQVIAVGYIVEAVIGQSIVAVEGSVANRPVTDDDVKVYFDLVGTAFEFAEAQIA